MRNKKKSSHLDLLVNKKNIVKSTRSTRRASNSKFVNRETLNSKHSQEEMVGFVLIIVLVSVIALIFLAISIRKPAIQGSREIESFLHSSLLLSTDCQPSPEEIYNLKNLIGACWKDEECLPGEKACDVLNITVYELLENLQVGEEAKYKGYAFRIYDEKNETIFYLTKGNYTSSKTATDALFPVEGENIHVVLEVFN